MPKHIHSAASKDLPLVVMATSSTSQGTHLPRSGATMSATIYHGIGCCLLQLPSFVYTQAPVAVPDNDGSGNNNNNNAGEGYFSVDEKLDGLVTESNWVPALCFCGLARSFVGVGGGSSSRKVAYKDGQPGGYSMVAWVKHKPLLLVVRNEQQESVIGDSNCIDPLNLRAVLRPMQINTKTCEVKSKGTNNKKAAQQFLNGDCSFPGTHYVKEISSFALL